MSEFLRPQRALPQEQEAIRARCLHPRGIFVEFRKEEIEQSIPERFEAQVAKYPERQAVKSRRRAFTYRDLNLAANRVAQAILEKRGQAPEPIALLLEQDALIFAAIIGVLKAGKIYVPLHPSYPPERLCALLNDAGARLIITNSAHLPLAVELARSGCQLINLDELDWNRAIESPGLPISPESFAYVLYTSGSTGEPKGVVQNHRNILHKTRAYTNDFRFCAEDRIALLSLSTFSLSVGFIFGALLNGACLYPVDVKEEDLESLASWFTREGITVYNSIPTVFRTLGDTLTGPDRFPELRLIHLGGEPVTWRDVEVYRKYFSPAAIFLHHLGSNETGTISQYFIDRTTPVHGSVVVPAGYADEDAEILLIDEHGQPAGYNQVGEIAVESRNLSPGYWRKPELTQTSFLPDPDGSNRRIYLTGDLGLMLADGCLMHLGRKDSQVKIRGNRVEVAEIEIALRDSAAIKEAVVLAREDTAGTKRIVAYMVPAKEPPPKISELRLFLHQKLPEHMVPAAFVFLQSLPLTPNGKIDRRTLPAPSRTRPELGMPYAAPRTPVEKELARIWAEVLHLDQIGIYDDFMELGGHSLAASRVVSRVIKSFRLNLPVQSLFQSPTVAKMGTLIAQTQARNSNEADLARNLAELESLSDEEAEAFMAQGHTGDTKHDEAILQRKAGNNRLDKT